MAKKIKITELQQIANSDQKLSAHGVVKLLLADHKLMRNQIEKIKSQKSTDTQREKTFEQLVKTVQSHVQAEEQALLKLIKDNPKFEDLVLEGYEEHRVHETVLTGIYKLSDKKRKIEQMKIFCEILEHHLDEEEEELFPRFKKYAALSTRKKMGRNFLKIRKKTNISRLNKGAARFSVEASASA